MDVAASGQCSDHALTSEPVAPAVVHFDSVDLASLFPARLPEQFDGWGVFGDLDGDGRTDVAVSWLVHPSAGSGAAFARFDPRTGTLVPIDLGSDAAAWPVGAIADVDGDGFADLVRLAGEAPSVLWGRGDGTFDAAGAPLPDTDITTSVWLDDLDGDGRTDLLFGVRSSTCAGVHAFRQTAARGFEPYEPMADVGGDVRTYVAVTFAPRPGTRMLGVLGDSCSGRPEPTFYSFAGGSETSAVAVAPVVPRTAIDCGGVPRVLTLSQRIPMGLALGDLDADGATDMVLTTAPQMIVLRGTGDATFTDATEAFGGRYEKLANQQWATPFTPAILDLDRDGRQDLVVTHGTDTNELSTEPQHVTLHRNAGGRFEDVTAGSGLDAPGEWHALAVGDLDDDGDPDLLVGSRNGRARLYRNAFTGGQAPFAVQLLGRPGRAFGTGAHVDVLDASDTRLAHHVAGGVAGTLATSEPIVFATVAPGESTGRVRVTWPSGTVQTIEHLAPWQRHTIVEPSP